MPFPDFDEDDGSTVNTSRQIASHYGKNPTTNTMGYELFVSNTSQLLLLPVIVSFLMLLIVRAIGLVVYRLYFSPLSGFPGPKLAAATHWYEVYYDLVSEGGGQFTFQIKRLHQEYGPIVRINPFELHIDDPEYYDVVFCNSSPSRPIDKIRKFKYRFNIPEATVQSTYAEEHRARRAAIAPCFSRARIRSRNDNLQGIVDRISHRLSTEYAGTDKVIDLNDMWAAMTTDIIMDMAFARATHFSNAPGFVSPFSRATAKMVHYSHHTTHFRFMVSVMNWVPDTVLGILMPPFRPILKFRQEMGYQIKEIMSGKNADAKDASHLTIFHDILSADLPPEDLSFSRLQQEAMGVNGGGIETTSWALAVASFHILHNQSIKTRLKAELTMAIPDETEIPLWDELEVLPYLSGVIMEALRLAYGSVQRLPRVNRLGTLTYGSWEIPPNIPVSMDAYHIHMNETIFPDPLKFRPERWLGEPKGPDGLRPLSYYVVSFSRGARNCLGMNLAWMELYIALATIFRRHDFELFETDRDDVDFIVDLVRPMPKRGSMGVRVVVK